MPAQCAVCGKQRIVKNKVSHSNRKTKSIQRPNLQRVHAEIDGSADPRARMHALPALGQGRQGRVSGLGPEGSRRTAAAWTVAGGPVDEHVITRSTAIASISTWAPRGSADTCTVDARRRRVREVAAVHLVDQGEVLQVGEEDGRLHHIGQRAPAAFSTADRFCRIRSVWAFTSPAPTSSPLLGSSGIWPEQYIVRPAAVGLADDRL